MSTKTTRVFAYRRSLAVAFVVGVAGCSSGSGGAVHGTGGSTLQTGGAPVSGGVMGSGGTSSTGGASGTGGAPGATGGTVGNGGVTSSGGNNIGGTTAIGGTAATGGATATGGRATTGGTASAGGATATGGTTTAGGGTAVGGATGTGGSSGTGGTTSAGGTSSTGGTAGTGGATGTGGASGRGGATGNGELSNAGGTLGRGGSGSGGATSTGGSSAGTGGSTGSGGGTGTSALLAPAQGALLGTFVGAGTITDVETTLGRKLAILHNFFGWSDNWVTRVPGDLADGRIPLITWETWIAGVGVPLDDIINGVHDTMITTRAQAARAVGQKFFLRWGHEMNGNWYPWDGFDNGANAAATTKYIATYKHIHDIFTSVGATNVLWIFCPNVDSVPGDAWNQWANYYPGDVYVDWVGFDGYNWGTSTATGTWQSFSTIAGRIYSSLAAKGKPMMIPETASSELGGDKAAWIAAIVPALKGSFPGIKALVWFDMNKETDWRFDSSATATAASKTMANNPYFNP